MIALCLAAILGGFIGPLLAVIFSSPTLMLTTPLFASLGALAAGCGLAFFEGRSVPTDAQVSNGSVAARGLAPENCAVTDLVPRAGDTLTDTLVCSLREVLSQADAKPGSVGKKRTSLAGNHLRKSS